MSDAIHRWYELGEMPWPKRSETNYHAQLGLADKGAIKGLVVCFVILLGSMNYGIGFGQAQGAWSGPLLWPGWLSRSSSTTP